MLRTLIFAAAAAAAAVALGAGALAAEPVPKAIPSSALDAAIDGIEARYRQVTDFKAEFEQEVRRAHLPRPLKKSGNVYFKSPGMMRWDYTQPERVYYVSDGDNLWSYEVATKQVLKMRVKDSELYDSLKFLFGQGDLRESFDITAADADADADAEKKGLVGLVLTPKKSQTNYKSLTLFADAKTFEIRMTELVDPLDNVSIITFDEMVYEPLKKEGFAFKPPKGANVQDLTSLPGGGGQRALMADEPAGKVFFVSLGCPKNRVDSEIMLGQLAARDFEVVGSAEEADLLVVNTCSFVEEAREESVDTILDLARVKADAGGEKRLVVAGCLSQRYSDELAVELPEVDTFLGTGDHWRIGELVKPAAGPLVAPRSIVGRPGYNYDSYSPRVVTTQPWTAYVKVAEGCSQRCSFCIIPRLRGGARSRPIDDVEREVRDLAARGVEEINLIAQDLTHYGDDRKDGTSLAGLLARLVKVDGVHWIRLLYCYPHNFTDALIDLIAGEEKIVSYVDMPLQHISNRMLEVMRRRFSEADTRRLVERMRTKIPDLVFRTTFIVGHPGETEADFRALYDFLAESRFERVGVFKYSREDGTRAARRDDHVMGLIKEDRYHRLMTLQQGISQEIHEAMVGREVEVLVEGRSKETDLLLEGRTWGQAPEIDGVTYLNEGWAEAGQVVRAEIVDSGDYDLVARIL